MQRLIRFLSYNNAVPIAVALLMVGGSAAFAATDPAAIYSTDQKVLTVDNTYLANKDLSSYNSRIEITGVTEDAENYYVAYNFYTIDVQDEVWQDVVKKNTLTVSKAGLGKYGDLGVYATEQFNQLIDHEGAYLTEAQAAAKKNVSQKTVATIYGGLVGKFLDSSTETLPGYEPVVKPPTAQAASAAAPVPDAPPSSASNTSPPSSLPASTADGSASTPAPPPVPPSSSGGMQVMGNNPAKIALKSSYADLGVYISSQHFQQFGLHTTLDGKEVSDVQIDTSIVGTHTITYTVTDDQGASLTGTRIVEVYNPYSNVVVMPFVASSTDATSTGTSTTP